MAEESEKNEEKTRKINSMKRTYYSNLEHSKLVEITLVRDERIENLENLNEQYKNDIIELRMRLRAHEPEKYDPPNYMGYQKDWPVIRKVIFILKRNVRALTSLQILHELIGLEPFYQKIWRDPANSISSLLCRACKKNLIVRVGSPGMGSPVYKVIRKKN